MDIVTYLEQVQNPNAEIRNEAETTLRRFEAENYPAFISSLCSVFNTATNTVPIQRLAAILLKNTLQSKDASVKVYSLFSSPASSTNVPIQMMMKEKWIQLDEATKREIHRELLKGLHNTEVDVCCTVSMVISTVGAVDLPANKWTELIPTLVQNMETPEFNLPLQKSTLEAMGYLCEELADLRDFSLPSTVVDRMLTTIVRGMTRDDVDISLRLSATRALLNALEFTEKNFANEQERTYIMTTLFQVLMSPASEQLREIGFECLSRICQIYYNHMAPYMDAAFKLTVEVIQRDDESVVKQAIEVWSTICEEESELAHDMANDLAQPDLVLHDFAKRAAPTLLPVILDQLMKQEEDQDFDDCGWTVSMAAGSCLCLFAEVIGNDIIPIVMPFVQANIKKNEGLDDWRCREAATYAFGAVLEGPDPKELATLACSGLSFLLGALKDRDPHVRNTTAWTIGRIFQFVHPSHLEPTAITAENIRAIVEGLLQKISERDEMHIIERVCFALEKLAIWCERHTSLSLAPFFKTLIEELLKVAFHPIDAQSSNHLQVAAFDAINQLVKSSSRDALDLVVQLIPFFTQKLSDSLHVPPTECEQHMIEMQGMICGCLSVIFCRLSDSEGHKIPLNQFSGQIFTLFSEVLQVNSSDVTVMEEVMNALGALVSTGVNFAAYARMLVPWIERGLRNNTQKYAFLSCVGAISDMFTNLGDAMEPYAQNILTILCDTLSCPTARREIKPPILSLLGDICLAITDRFQKFLSVVNNILKQATQMAVTEMPNMDEEDIIYLNQLMLGIIEAYAGIAQGLSTDLAGQFLAGEHETLMEFLSYIARDRTRNVEVTKQAMGLLGDVIGRTPRFTPALNQKAWMERFIQECAESQNASVSQAAERARLIYSCVCP